MPSYLNNGTSVVRPAAAHVLNNTTNFTDPLGNTHNTLADQDVLLLRGYFENDPYFADVAGSSLLSEHQDQSHHRRRCDPGA